MLVVASMLVRRMAKTPSDLGKRVTKLREISGLSSRALSELAGLSHGALGQLERGELADLTTGSANRLAAALGVSIDFLVRGNGEMPTEERVRAAVESARVPRGPDPEAA